MIASEESSVSRHKGSFASRSRRAAWFRCSVAVALIAATMPVKATASECLGFSLPYMLGISAVVFSGKVRSIDKPRPSDTPYGDVVRVTFDVRRVFKGTKARRIVLHEWVHTGITDFDNPFVVGRVYSVFAMDNRENTIASAPRSAFVARHCDAGQIDAEGERRLAADIRAAAATP
jgi:hypothetical protein